MADPILCVVGAGVHRAARTAVLTSALTSWRGTLDPLSAPDYVKHGYEWWGRPKFEGPDRKPFYEWLQTQLPSHSGVPLNFEDLIHVVDVAHSMLGTIVDGTYSEPFRSFTSDLVVPAALGSVLQSQYLELLSAHSRKFILDTVFRLTNGHSRLDASKLLEMLSQDLSHRLWVFSLNYDSLVTETVPCHWWTSYGSPATDGAAFEPHALFPQDRDLSIQMHGSIYFGITGLEIATRHRLYNSFAEASETWRNHHYGSSITSDGFRVTTIPMITGRRKSEQLQVEPFASYLQYFRQAALSTPRWLLLGYGGADAHVNYVMQAAAEKWGSRLKVVVCNYLAPPDGSATDVIMINKAGVEFTTLDRLFASTFYDDFKLKFRGGPSKLPIFRSSGTKMGRILLMLDGKFSKHAAIIEHWLK